MNNSRPADAVSFLSNACNRELELHLKSGAMKISLQPNKKNQTTKNSQPPGPTIMKNLPIIASKLAFKNHPTPKLQKFNMKRNSKTIRK